MVCAQTVKHLNKENTEGVSRRWTHTDMVQWRRVGVFTLTCGLHFHFEPKSSLKLNHFKMFITYC